MSCPPPTIPKNTTQPSSSSSAVTIPPLSSLLLLFLTLIAKPRLLPSSDLPTPKRLVAFLRALPDFLGAAGAGDVYDGAHDG